MHLLFTLCARICFYYRITSNICMRRRLNVCHSFCSNAPKQLLPFSTLHAPCPTPPSFGTQNPLAFAFMCGASTNLPTPTALLLPHLPPFKLYVDMQIEARIFRTSLNRTERFRTWTRNVCLPACLPSRKVFNCHSQVDKS